MITDEDYGISVFLGGGYTRLYMGYMSFFGLSVFGKMWYVYYHLYSCTGSI